MDFFRCQAIAGELAINRGGGRIPEAKIGLARQGFPDRGQVVEGVLLLAAGLVRIGAPADAVLPEGDRFEQELSGRFLALPVLPAEDREHQVDRRELLLPAQLQGILRDSSSCRRRVSSSVCARYGGSGPASRRIGDELVGELANLA